ncbi:hypothetical protein VNO77_04551 [Canavalia gladiata]|uniref:Uncharacterized protein n=1 Tax=Canavalia gladiata TaxID=3824 RepID=A0AAN9N1U9_CANGL
MPCNWILLSRTRMPLTGKGFPRLISKLNLSLLNQPDMKCLHQTNLSELPYSPICVHISKRYIMTASNAGGASAVAAWSKTRALDPDLGPKLSC